MTILAACMVLIGAAQVQVHLAPDQPIPYVYVDDPLIVELKSEIDATPTVRLTVESSHTPPIERDLGQIILRPQGAAWQVVETSPNRGCYQVKLTIEADGARQEETLAFCRIDRPGTLTGNPWGVELATAEKPSLLAMSGIPVQWVHLNAGAPEVEKLIAQAATAGFQVALMLNMDTLTNVESVAETISKNAADRVARWDLQTSGVPEKLVAVAQAIQRGGARAPVTLAVDNPLALRAALAAGVGQFMKGITIIADGRGPTDIGAFLKEAEESGYESPPLSVFFATPASPAPADGGAAQALVQPLRALLGGASEVALDADLLYRDGTFQEAYPRMSALAHRLSGAAYVGKLPAPNDAQAGVFRVGSGWTVVLWGTLDSKELAISLGDAASLALTDGLNNSLSLPELKEGALTIPLTSEPQFLSGVGGTVLAQGAERRVRQEAEAFSGNEDFLKLLSKEFLDLVKGVAQKEPGKSTRLEFLALLKGFPAIEEQWHGGKIPRTVAVPALAGLQKLCRCLCVLQQEGGEPFVEPLRKTLDSCAQYQSQYLTSSGGASGAQERGDWLSQQVSRLVTEAEGLDRDGRPIEAAAVAAVAEWRARSLEYALKAAPLSKPDPFAALPKEEEPAKDETKSAAPPGAPDSEKAPARTKKKRK